jgi:GTPase SAR1 family protein
LFLNHPFKPPQGVKMSIFLDTANKLQNENVSKYIRLFSNLDTKKLAEIVVVGEFSNGKSTLVNALMGLDILPSGIGAVTNNITTIKKGELNQLQCENFSQKDINVNDIKSVIENQENHNLKEIKIELANFPFKDYVIVDTPGINDQNRERELITYEYAPKCDAMIFVLDIARGFTKYESDFFSDLSETAKDKIFVVLNKYDAYEHIEHSKIYQMLKDQGISENKAFIVSSKMALSSIQEKNHEMLKASGILSLRQELFQYVDNSQSKIVLKKRKQTILNRIEELCITEIDSNISSLKMNHDEIETSIQKLEQDALEAEIEAEKIISALNEKTRNISEKINDILHCLKRELSDELFYKSPYEIKDFVQSGQYAKIVSLSVKNINDLLNSNIAVEFFELKTDFILVFFEQLPFLKEWINSPIVEDITNVIFSVVTINPTTKSVFELIKKYSKVALEYVSNQPPEFSTLKEKIDDGIASIENSVKAEIDRYMNNQKMSIFYKTEQLNSKVQGAKKARDEKKNQKDTLDNIINEQTFIKSSLLKEYEIELAKLDAEISHEF